MPSPHLLPSILRSISARRRASAAGAFKTLVLQFLAARLHFFKPVTQQVQAALQRDIVQRTEAWSPDLIAEEWELRLAAQFIPDPDICRAKRCRMRFARLH